MAEKEIEVMDTPLEIPKGNLTAKQAKFVASYQLTHNSTQSALNAGYPLKSAPSIGCQLLKNPKIIAELELWKTKKREEITKEDYVDLAISDYRSLKLEEPNKPRFLDIAGKALGYIGANNTQNITNNTQINIRGDVNLMSPQNKWDALRSMMEND